MGSGRANDELTCKAKKAREIKRREKTHRKRLVALGMSETAAGKLTSRACRLLLQRPEKTRQQLAKTAPKT